MVSEAREAAEVTVSLFCCAAVRNWYLAVSRKVSAGSTNAYS